MFYYVTKRKYDYRRHYCHLVVVNVKRYHHFFKHANKNNETRK